jgi:hypothetical protein
MPFSVQFIVRSYGTSARFLPTIPRVDPDSYRDWATISVAPMELVLVPTFKQQLDLISFFDFFIKNWALPMTELQIAPRSDGYRNRITENLVN